MVVKRTKLTHCSDVSSTWSQWKHKFHKIYF